MGFCGNKGKEQRITKVPVVLKLILQSTLISDAGICEEQLHKTLSANYRSSTAKWFTTIFVTVKQQLPESWQTAG